MQQENERLKKHLAEFISREIPLTVGMARALNVCRICGREMSAPFMLNYGDEFSHSACLEKSVPEQHSEAKAKPENDATKCLALAKGLVLVDLEVIHHELGQMIAGRQHGRSTRSDGRLR